MIKGRADARLRPPNIIYGSSDQNRVTLERGLRFFSFYLGEFCILAESIAELDAGGGEEHELIDV